MAGRIKSVSTFIKLIRAVLELEGVYSPIYDMAIADLAQVSHLKAIAFDDATSGFNNKEVDNDGKRSVVYELSREGDRRYKVNPAYTIYIDLVRESQKILSELCMTAKSSSAVQDDEFTELKSRMEKAANGE